MTDPVLLTDTDPQPVDPPTKKKAKKSEKFPHGVTSISRDNTGKIVVLVMEGERCVTDPSEIEAIFKE